ncbi:MAG: hypothetical protein AAGI90_02525 [Chlamydiota bacterium]
MSGISQVSSSKAFQLALQKNNSEECARLLDTYTYKKLSYAEVDTPLAQVIYYYPQKKACFDAVLQWYSAQGSRQLQSLIACEKEQKFQNRFTYRLFSKRDQQQKEIIPTLQKISGLWAMVFEDLPQLKINNISLWSENRYLRSEIEKMPVKTTGRQEFFLSGFKESLPFSYLPTRSAVNKKLASLYNAFFNG